MKKGLSILIILMISFALVACSSSDEASSKKNEEEIKAELRKEMEEEVKEELKKELEAEAKSEIQLPNNLNQNQEQVNKGTETQKDKNEENPVVRLSDDELKASKAEYEAKFYEYLSRFSGGFYSVDIREFEHYKNDSEFKAYVDKLLVLGYGFEQAEGNYYLYVGEPVGYKEEGEEPKKQEDDNDSSDDVLIEKLGSNFYKYKTNTTLYFDIDGDGTDEEIRYDVQDAWNAKLIVKGYEPIEIFTDFGETEYFVIVKFHDKFDISMNMIGIIEYGPSMDPATQLYSIIAPMGKNTLVSVGTVPGQLVHSSQYDPDNFDDFNYKAIILDNKGIEAPVRLSPTYVGTWFGRNLFTYYSTYCSLIDNSNKYEQDYQTNVVLNIEKSVKAYKEKDLESDNVTINGGQKVTLTSTDNKEWIYMKANDKTEGWVNVKDVTADNFSGFPMYD